MYIATMFVINLCLLTNGLDASHSKTSNAQQTWLPGITMDLSQHQQKWIGAAVIAGVCTMILYQAYRFYSSKKKVEPQPKPKQPEADSNSGIASEGLSKRIKNILRENLVNEIKDSLNPIFIGTSKICTFSEQWIVDLSNFINSYSNQANNHLFQDKFGGFKNDGVLQFSWRPNNQFFLRDFFKITEKMPNDSNDEIEKKLINNIGSIFSKYRIGIEDLQKKERKNTS